MLYILAIRISLACSWAQGESELSYVHITTCTELGKLANSSYSQQQIAVCLVIQCPLICFEFEFNMWPMLPCCTLMETFSTPDMLTCHNRNSTRVTYGVFNFNWYVWISMPAGNFNFNWNAWKLGVLRQPQPRNPRWLLQWVSFFSPSIRLMCH